MEEKIFRFILGFLIMPFLYMRYSFVLFLPILFYVGINDFIVLMFIYNVFYGFIMGNIGLMKYWTKFLQNILNVKYNIKGEWKYGDMHTYNIWSYPILVVRNKEYKISLSVNGGNVYDKDDNIRRKAIVYWLFY